MARIGFHLSCEEHPAPALVEYGRRAEAAGFDFLTISDHYHPWSDAQGESPFVWAVIGGLAQVTEHVPVVTAVTCPTVRIHPAVIAQAAATAATLLPGRFVFGVGTGEALNEHITGDAWPRAAVRREMLEEAVAVIRRLWAGGMVSHRGTHYTVENARVYSLPEELPPIVVAAAGPRAAELAGRIGDGFMTVSPDADLRERFERAGGAGKPCYGKLDVCFGEDEAEARRIAHRVWGATMAPGELGQVLPVPAHYEQVAQGVTEEEVAEAVVCGPDPERHAAAIREYLDAGLDHVSVQQIGPEQEAFAEFYAREVLPRVREGAPV